MKNKHKNIDEVLLLRIIENRAIDAEKIRFEEWFKSSSENAEFFSQLKRTGELSSNTHSAQADWKRVVDKVRAGYNVPEYIELPDSRVVENRIGISILWRVAAMVIFFLGLAFLLRNIVFDPEQLISGTALKNNEPYQLVDGSVVYLRGDSEIRFTRSFGSKNRKIDLSGEAFFEVAGNNELPFLISANKTTTRVAGTSFNVLSDPDGKVEVTVVSGVVEFSSGKSNIFELHAGEQGIFNPASAGIVKSVITTPNFHAWKSGVIVFKDTQLNEAFELLGQLYLKTFVYDREPDSTPAITTIFDNQSLETILEELNILFNTETESRNDSIIFKSAH
jgi:transmembrane sensor